MATNKLGEPLTKLVTLNLKGIKDKKKAKEEAGKLIVEGIQDYLDQSESPVEGGKFKPRKVDGSRSILIEEYDMRPAIESKNRRGDQIEVGVYKKAEVKKAYGHNSGFKGHPNEKKMKAHRREFIPASNKKFKDKITDRVNQRMNELRRGQEQTQLEELETTTLDRLFEQATGGAQPTQQSSGSNLTVNLGSLLDILDGN
jgi:hypothetical protein